ncbi:MAG: SpaA isopeptide-forming pilin-related protein [Bacillota bacterium]|nr:SpaA isopeptide-forming pilin-related protein [Bacillota bacterium]
MKTRTKNLIFILLTIVLFSLANPFSVFAEENTYEVKFQQKENLNVLSRKIVLWKYDQMLEASSTEDANKLLEDLKKTYNANKLEEKLESPLEIEFTKGENGDLIAELEPGYYVGYEVLELSSEETLRAFHGFWLKDKDLIIQPKFSEDQVGKIILLKTDDKGKPLANVGFRLYFATDHPLNDTNELLAVNIAKSGEEYSYDLDGQVMDLYTNNEGKIVVNNLPAGDYVFREIKALSGYTIENRDTVFVVVANGSTEKTIINKPGGAFNFKKIDGQTNMALKNAKFKVVIKDGNDFKAAMDKDGNEIILVSDEEGRFSVSGLPYGTYYLIEISPPSGYKLLTEAMKFEIGQGSETKLMIIENIPDNPPDEPPENPPDQPPDEPPGNPPDEPPGNPPGEPPEEPFTIIYKENPPLNLNKRPNLPLSGQIPKTGDITIIIMSIVGMAMVFLGNYFVHEEKNA